MFVKIDINSLDVSTTKLIGKDWMLVTAGNLESCNTMTASWGGLGELWNRRVAFVFIRPGRFTYEFVEKEDYFTLSFFDEGYRKALQYCGSVSGRDADKIGECGLTKVETENGSVFFKEARLVMECRKIYYTDIDPNNFLDDAIAKNYPKMDYHRMYVGEIVNTYQR